VTVDGIDQCSIENDGFYHIVSPAGCKRRRGIRLPLPATAFQSSIRKPIFKTTW
jgi:hypothetical protein